MLEPKTFRGLVRIVALCLAPERRFQEERLSGQLLDTLDSINDLHLRGQCAGCLYWALALLWYRQ